MCGLNGVVEGEVLTIRYDLQGDAFARVGEWLATDGLSTLAAHLFEVDMALVAIGAYGEEVLMGLIFE